MKILGKYFLILFLFLIGAASAFAEASFVIEAPNVVHQNGRFQLSFIVSNGEDLKDFTPPMEEISKNFNVLAGPSQSRSSETYITNGKMTSLSKLTFTYVLSAKEIGKFTIPPAKITSGNKKLMSNSFTVRVVEGGESNNTGGNSEPQRKNISDINIKDEVFIRHEVSKSKMYEQEQVVLTTTLYYAVNVSRINDLKYLEFNGALAQEVELSDNEKYGRTVVNGRSYETFVIKKHVLTPQKSGKITFDKGYCDLLINVPVQSGRRDVFGRFFTQTKPVNQRVLIPALTLDVTALPEKPEDFCGGVGSFDLQSSINAEQIKANEAVTVKLKISGNGNIKYIKYPKIAFPNDFEVYDPKVETKVKGSTGSMNVEFMAIPRYPGEYVIPSAEFSYFDLKTKRYKKLKTKEFNLVVEKGDAADGAPVVAYSSKENVKLIGKDIRYLNNKDLRLKAKDDFFYGSTAYWLWIIIPLLISTVVFVLYRNQIKQNANVVLMKNRKANKKAIKRLKLAKTYLDNNNKSAFYEEVLKSLWGYTSDKLNIPVSQLSKDNIENELSSHGASDELLAEFMDILKECEFARFAPAEGSDQMAGLYDKTIEVITNLDQEVRI